MARNCMHGLRVLESEGGGKAGTELRLSFEQKMKTHWIWDWLMNHPRVVIPAVAALVASEGQQDLSMVQDSGNRHLHLSSEKGRRSEFRRHLG